MSHNVREQVYSIFDSLKKGETFSFDIRQKISEELKRVSEEAVEYNKKKRESQIK